MSGLVTVTIDASRSAIDSKSEEYECSIQETSGKIGSNRLLSGRNPSLIM
ncbi:hypothetical protein HNO89_000299 [Sporosarcina luteola]|nr:hypothetical protein [Sporosarcina luteola]